MKLQDAHDELRAILDGAGMRDVSITFQQNRNRLGTCQHYPSTHDGRGFRIMLSSYLVALNTREVVRRTMIHEAAHALVGWDAGHGVAWRKAAAMLGLEKQFINRRNDGEGDQQLPHGWSFRCENCGTRMFDKKDAVPDDMKGWKCGACKSRDLTVHAHPANAIEITRKKDTYTVHHPDGTKVKETVRLSHKIMTKQEVRMGLICGTDLT